MPYTHHLRNIGSASELHRISARHGLKSSSSLFALALFALCAISAFVSSALPSIALADSPIVAERVGMSGERLALLDNNLERYNEDSRLAGQVYIVLRHGEVVAHEANGMQDVARGVAMNTDSIFRIASQTKAITSLAIMMFRNAGFSILTNLYQNTCPNGVTCRSQSRTTLAATRSSLPEMKSLYAICSRTQAA